MSQTALDFDAPPPAYEVTQEELDRKISHAIETSLREPRPAPVARATAEDDWEVWDEAAFKRAEEQQQQPSQPTQSPGSSSSTFSPSSSRRPLPPVSHGRVPIIPIAPLSIVRKSEKERPSWYAEAQLEDHASSPSASSSAGGFGSPGLSSAGSPTVPSPRAWREQPPPPPPQLQPAPRGHAPSSDGHGREERFEPPPFTPIGPSLDGPPYEEHEIVLTYPPPGSGSRTPSPLASPELSFAPLPLRPQSQYDASLLANFSSLGPSMPGGEYDASLLAEPVARPRPGASPLPRPASNYGMPPPPSPPPVPRQQQQQRTMPPPPRRMVSRLGPRQPTAPASTQARVLPSTADLTARMSETVISFDLKSAYQKSHQHHASTLPPGGVHNPSAYYNSAVAAHIGPANPPIHRPTPHHAATMGVVRSMTPAAAYAEQHRPTPVHSANTSSSSYGNVTSSYAPANASYPNHNSSMSYSTPPTQTSYGNHGRTPSWSMGLSVPPPLPTQYASYPLGQTPAPALSAQYAQQASPPLTNSGSQAPLPSPPFQQTSPQPSQYPQSLSGYPQQPPLSSSGYAQSVHHYQPSWPASGAYAGSVHHFQQQRPSPPASTGYAQQPSYGSAYGLSGAGGPSAGMAQGQTTAQARLQAQTANTELRTAHVELLAQTAGFAAAGLSIAGALMGAEGGGGEAANQ